MQISCTLEQKDIFLFTLLRTRLAGGRSIVFTNAITALQRLKSVLTVLEVLLHDPLYNWSVGPGRAASKQEAGQWEELQRENEGGNKMANR